MMKGFRSRPKPQALKQPAPSAAALALPEADGSVSGTGLCPAAEEASRPRCHGNRDCSLHWLLVRYCLRPKCGRAGGHLRGWLLYPPPPSPEQGLRGQPWGHGPICAHHMPVSRCVISGPPTSHGHNTGRGGGFPPPPEEGARPPLPCPGSGRVGAVTPGAPTPGLFRKAPAKSPFGK